MRVFEPRATPEDDRRWRVSGRSSALGVRAWTLAVAVVAALALGLAFLHG